MELFAAHGFGQAGVRDIAARADANPGLVSRYFGSKEALFRAALEGALIMEPILATDRGQLGKRIVEIFTGSDTAPNPLSMMILSAGDPAARVISIEVIERRVIAPLARYLGAPDGELRAARLNILWTGFLMARQLLPLSVVAEARGEPLLLWLAEETQAIVDESAVP